MTQYAKTSEVRAGTIVRADSGFTCMSEGLKTVRADEGGLYIPCSAGRHYLDGQLDRDVQDGEAYIGITMP